MVWVVASGSLIKGGTDKRQGGGKKYRNPELVGAAPECFRRYTTRRQY